MTVLGNLSLTPGLHARQGDKSCRYPAALHSKKSHGYCYSPSPSFLSKGSSHLPFHLPIGDIPFTELCDWRLDTPYGVDLLLLPCRGRITSSRKPR